MKPTLRNLALASAIALTFGGISVGWAADPKPHDTAGEQIADARREAQIWTSFAMNPHLHAFELSVKVDGNKAVLDGKVENSVAKDLAGQIAQDAEGIAHVDNRIAVDANYVRPARATSERSFSEKVNDATVTASVKSRLLWNAHTDGLDIHVDTNNGKVTLTGSAATAAEKELAGHIATDTNGVVGVNNEITLSNKPEASAEGQGRGRASRTGSVRLMGHVQGEIFADVHPRREQFRYYRVDPQWCGVAQRRGGQCGRTRTGGARGARCPWC